MFYHCYTCSIYGSFGPEIKYLYLYLTCTFKRMYCVLGKGVRSRCNNNTYYTKGYGAIMNLK